MPNHVTLCLLFVCSKTPWRVSIAKNYIIWRYTCLTFVKSLVSLIKGIDRVIKMRVDLIAIRFSIECKRVKDARQWNFEIWRAIREGQSVIALGCESKWKVVSFFKSLKVRVCRSTVQCLWSFFLSQSIQRIQSLRVYRGSVEICQTWRKSEKKRVIYACDVDAVFTCFERDSIENQRYLWFPSVFFVRLKPRQDVSSASFIIRI